MDDIKSISDHLPGEEKSPEAMLAEVHVNQAHESLENTTGLIERDTIVRWVEESPKNRAATTKALLDLMADAVEKAERLGTEVESVQVPTWEELEKIEANFTDDDWRNFLAMRENDGSPDLGIEVLPTGTEYEKATGRKLTLKRRE